MIEALAGFRESVLAFACHGRVTRSDYENVLIPAIQRVLSNHAKARLYYETSADFTGIGPGAILEDLKVGFDDFGRWDRIAVVSDVDWIRDTVRAFGFLLPGHLRVFHLREATDAREWINEG